MSFSLRLSATFALVRSLLATLRVLTLVLTLSWGRGWNLGLSSGLSLGRFPSLKLRGEVTISVEFGLLTTLSPKTENPAWLIRRPFKVWGVRYDRCNLFGGKSK